MSNVYPLSGISGRQIDMQSQGKSSTRTRSSSWPPPSSPAAQVRLNPDLCDTSSDTNRMIMKLFGLRIMEEGVFTPERRAKLYDEDAVLPPPKKTTSSTPSSVSRLLTWINTVHERFMGEPHIKHKPGNPTVLPLPHLPETTTNNPPFTGFPFNFITTQFF